MPAASSPELASKATERVSRDLRADLWDVKEAGPEAGGGQGKAAGQGDGLAIGQQDVSSRGIRLPVLLVNQHLGLQLDQRLGVPAWGQCSVRLAMEFAHLPNRKWGSIHLQHIRVPSARDHNDCGRLLQGHSSPKFGTYMPCVVL